MRTTRFLLVLVALATLLVFAAPALADTITVPRDYASIQEAISAAAPGDTVWVAAGVYDESVVVDKTITLAGAGSDQTIVDGAGKGHVIEIADDDVIIRDLAVRNGSMDWPAAGINLNSASGCLIERCDASTTWAGIRFVASPKNVIRACAVHENVVGIDLGDTGSSDNTLVDCTATTNKLVGYNAYAGSDGLRILRCAATYCGVGVTMAWSKDWVVECCTITLCETGIVFDAATNGIVRHNTVTDILTNGMWVAGPGSWGNAICANLFARCANAGIVLQGAATSNSIHDNRLQECGVGVYIMFNASSPNQGNTFFRNAFVKNTVQAADESGYSNAFNDAYPWGNYWDDASGDDDYSGPLQDIPGADGVFDKGYKVGECFDQYPATTADEKAPGTSITAGPVGWVNTCDVAFSWEGNDDRTPPEYLAYSYSLDGEAWIFDTVTGVSFEKLAEGEHTFDVMARDGMGQDDPRGDRATFGVDVTAPLTEDDGDTAWHQTDTTVHFLAYDELSGIDYTEYSLDGGGSWTADSEVTLTAPSDGSGDGVFTVHYRSVDLAGNVEETRSCGVKISTQSFAFDHLGAPVGGTGDGVNAVITADLDGDGDPDVASGSGAAADTEILARENDGSPFVGGWPMGDVGASADTIYSLAAADLDNDGDLDLVSGSGDQEDYEIIAWENDGTPFDGGWVQHDLGPVASNVTCHAEIALADLDNDGWVDLVSATSAYGGNGALYVWQNDHTPWDGWWPSRSVVFAASMGAVAAADLTGDGWVDVVTAVNESTLLIPVNMGDPFNPSASWGMRAAGVGGPGTISDIAPADFNGDGLDDLATSLGYLPSYSQWVWVNPAAAGSWPQVSYADTPAASVAVGDLDGDGLIDLFSGSHGSGPELLAHDGMAPAPWAGFGQYEVADLDASVRSVALADCDLDGDLDAVSGSDASPGDEVLAWENLHTVDSVDPWSWSTYDGNWTNHSVDLDLQADDIGSGVHHIEYKIGDRGDWKIAPPGSVPLGKRGWGGGIYAVYHRAVDNAGNVEPREVTIVGVDGKPPRSIDDADDAWHGEDVTVTISASDDLSGVRYQRYSVDGGAWQGGGQVTIAALEDHSNDGVHEVRYYAVDWAGNRESVRRCQVRIDTAAPIVLRATAVREGRPAAAGGPALQMRLVGTRLRVAFAVADQGSRRVDIVVRVRDARGRVLERVTITGARVDRLRTLRFAGAAADHAASVRITVRDQAGFARVRTLRL